MRKNINKVMVLIVIIIAISSSVACASKDSSKDEVTGIAEIKTKIPSREIQVFELGIEIGRYQVMIENYYEEGVISAEEMTEYNLAKQAYVVKKENGYEFGEELNTFYYLMKDMVEKNK